MNDLILLKPSRAAESMIREYRQEYLDYGENHINGSCGLAHFDRFDEWLALVGSIEKERLSIDGVHASTFFSVRKSDGKIIGSIQLRHSLTDDLKKHGGHIGYGIRPTERRKGYGKQQLLLVLGVAKKMGIPKVMISCNQDNPASAHTIKSCGGILTEQNTYRGIAQLIYWITLS